MPFLSFRKFTRKYSAVRYKACKRGGIGMSNNLGTYGILLINPYDKTQPRLQVIRAFNKYQAYSFYRDAEDSGMFENVIVIQFLHLDILEDPVDDNTLNFKTTFDFKLIEPTEQIKD